MSKKRQEARRAISTAADLLMAEIAAGKWVHHRPQLNSIPVEQWDEVIREFALRCPGLGRDDYVEALRRSQFHNR